MMPEEAQSQYRDDPSRRDGKQVDATTGERRPCDRLNRTQYPW